MPAQKETYITKAVLGLGELAAEFADELGRKPTSSELMEILTLALKSGSGDVLADVNPANILGLRAQPSSGPTTAEPASSTVQDLDDAAFVIAGEVNGDLMAEIKSRNSAPPDLKSYCDLLLEALHRCDDDLISDISPKQLTVIKAETNKKAKISVAPGDIVAIPAPNGEYFLAVVITRNKYGVAFGLFRGTSKLRHISATSHPQVRKYPVYSDDEFIVSGRWKLLGRDERLLSLFPAEPEIFFRKQVIRGAEKAMDKIGQYGTGKTAAGGSRDLSRGEAEELGLFDNTYRQSYMPEILEDYLKGMPE